MFNTINEDDNYTIICTQLQYGQTIKPCKKEDVRNECEKYRKLLELSAKNNDNKIYGQVEVINNSTGEIREYWNTEQKNVLF